MRITDEQFEEWHEHIYKERNRLRNFVSDIINGVPTIHGMASTYRPMTLAEIRERARKLLEDL